jgi:ribosomal protein S18 acetylase RimI-like enzyme
MPTPAHPDPSSADRAFTVRDARPDERAAVRDLTLRAYREFESVMDPASWAGLDGAVRAALASTGRADCIVAEERGLVIGSVMLYEPNAAAYGDLAQAVECPEVRLVAVAPEARGRGVARALMEECIRRARARGAEWLGLHTSRSMRTAMALYARMGFERDPRTDFQPPGAELVEGYRLRL